MKNTVWLLQASFNDYDQHGAYTHAVFAKRPTLEELTKVLNDEGRAADVLADRGRRNYEYMWYNLRQVTFGEAISEESL
jgi:hypothetical protein